MASMSASTSRQTLQHLARSGLRHRESGRQIKPAVPSDFSQSRRGQHESLSTFGSRRYLHSSTPTRQKEDVKKKKRADVQYNFNTSLYFAEDNEASHENYRRVTAAELRSRKEPPTKVKMLVRDFIDDSLYNPSYGYFSKNATIFSPPGEGYDFSKFSNQGEFEETVAQRYVTEYGEMVEGASGRQVWHTPTELFKPYYAQALVSAILQSYKLNHYPYQDLIIYELGAGNGTFMHDALLFLKKNHPEVYERTRYNIIEISPQLAKRQRERARKAGLSDRVEIIESDFFKWDGGGPEPCYVVALEVLDNFAHDMIRYDVETLEPLQGLVVIDGEGEFSLIYEPVKDPLLQRCFEYRSLLPPTPSTLPTSPSLLNRIPFLRKAYKNLPFAPNLTKPDFVPSKAVLFLERLRAKLPSHRLLVADFSELPDAVQGRNGPVVQTRVRTEMVPCETFLVKQGYFDIFFPTDFELLKDTYSLIMNSPPAGLETTSKSWSAQTSVFQENFFSHSVKGFRRRHVGIYAQDEFMQKFGGEEIISKMTMKDGSNVVNRMYGNAKVMF